LGSQERENFSDLIFGEFVAYISRDLAEALDLSEQVCLGSRLLYLIYYHSDHSLELSCIQDG